MPVKRWQCFILSEAPSFLRREERNMSLSETKPRKTPKRPTRDLVILPALLVIVLIESLMNTGVWRFFWPLLALIFLSPLALKAWACVLIGRVLLASVVTWGPLDWATSSGFLAVRTAFVWIMLAQNKLLAANRLVQALSRMLAPYGRVSRKLLIATAALIILSVIFFAVPRPYLLVGLALFLIHITTRVPRPVPGAGERKRAGPAEIALVVASVLVCLALFELLLRLFVPPPAMVDNFMYIPHPRAIFCLEENAEGGGWSSEYRCTYIISDQGFRDRHYARKDDSVYRILSIGDSFAMGHGVSLDEAYSKMLEKLLCRHNANIDFEVINGGTGGHGVWQALVMLEERGLPLDPDMVILEVHPQTDIRDALVRAGKVMRCYDSSWQSRLRRFSALRARRSFRWSRALGFAYERCLRFWDGVQRHLRSPLRRRVYALPPSSDERPWWWEASLATYYPELEEGWKLLEQSVCQIARVCRDRGIQLVVFAVPASGEISSTCLEIVKREPNFDLDLYDLDKTVRLVKELCERNGIEFVDITPRFREESRRGEVLYFQQDGHWTSKGHRLCAQVLYEHLLKTHMRELVSGSGEES